MAHLPLEIVEYIFEYLTSVEDLKSACLVCQQWYQAFQNKKFRQKELVIITADKQFGMLADMENRRRKYSNFLMKDIDITDSSMPFWKRYGSGIRQLKLRGCYIRERIFINAMAQCKNLEYLVLHDCKELLMSGLSLEDPEDCKLLEEAWTNIRSLNLSSNRYLSDAILLKLIGFCPKLERLVLNGCPISYHSGMVRKFYPDGIKVPSQSVITFKAIHSFVLNSVHKLKELSLNETLVDNNSLQLLAQTARLKLSALGLSSCPQISNEGILYFCNSLTLLTDLDISFCVRLTDPGLITICSSLPLLQRLSLQGCRGISDMGVANLCQLGRLVSLNISECETLEGKGILKGLCHKENREFRDLRLAHMPLITDAVVHTLAKYLPALEHLDLSHSELSVTDIAVQSIFKNCTKLRYLDLSMCEQISDSGLTGMGVDFTLEPNVRKEATHMMCMPLGTKAEIEIIREAKVRAVVIKSNEKELLKAQASGLSLKNLRGLQYLNLSGCSRISDISLKYAFQFNELRELDLSNCSLISSEGLKYLAVNNTAIESLNLDECGAIDDDGVHHVVKNLTRLRKLVLGSNKITNAIARMIQNNALMLNYIDLRHCGQITESGVGELYVSLPFLRTFHCPAFGKVESLTYYIPPAPKTFRWFRRT